MLARRVLGQKAALRRGFAQVVGEPATWNAPATIVTTLPNGVRVATRETFGEAVSVGCFVQGGHRAETKDSVGAAYALEQLARNGSKKHGQVINEVESLGGILNVSAGREMNTYTMSCGKTDVKQSVDILADLVTSPNLDSFDKQKSEMIANLESLEIPTRDVMMDRLHLCAFRDSSLGHSKIDTERIEALSGAGLASYVAQTHTSNNIVLAASGPVKHADLVQMATASLGGASRGTVAPGATKPYFCGAELIYRNDEMGPTAHMAIGFEGVSWKSSDAVTFMLMQQIIGSYKKKEGLIPGKISGNRVINNVANKMAVGCADEYDAFNLFYKDTGLFGFYIACDEVAVEHAQGELFLGVNMLSFSITDEEVERAKRELKAKIFGNMDSSLAACKQIGQEVTYYGRALPAAELVLRLEAIDAEEVKRVAYSKLHDAEISVTALGPLHGMPSYYEMRRQTYMYRY